MKWTLVEILMYLFESLKRSFTKLTKFSLV